MTQGWDQKDGDEQGAEIRLMAGTILSTLTSRGFALRAAAMVHDVVMGAAAFYLALFLRLSQEPDVNDIGSYALAGLAFGLLVGLIGLSVGMNRGIWRYASMSDITAIIKTACISVCLFVVLHFLIREPDMLPRSTMAISWAFLVIFLSAPRAIYRSYRNHRDTRRDWTRRNLTVRNVLLIGAGDNADMFLKSISEQRGPPYKVLAILDERRRRVGRFIRGVPILGGPERLPEIVERFRRRGVEPDAVILTRSREEYQRFAAIDDLVAASGELGLELLRLPNLLDMRDIGSDFDLRPLRIEDLLQRQPVRADRTRSLELVGGRRILITGAGGSIGSELARQVASLGPAELVCVDASEYLLYKVETELRRRHPTLKLQAVLGNVRSREAIQRIFEAQQPEIVFHAAALKHVPIVERQPLEGLFTNAVGTRNVAEAAIATGVGLMVMISTDKAVNPANVMGASKRLAEMFCQAHDMKADEGGTRFTTVRFGNVLGSAGSVVPLFEKQLKEGGPLTVTHPDMERYFMTVPEACTLVIQAAWHGMANRAVRGRIYVLDMGTPVKIVDLARNVIRLSGLRPDVDVQIVYTGLRPGEKLYEELFASSEMPDPTGTPGLLIAFPRVIEQGLVVRIFDELARHIRTGDLAGALRLVKSTVPEFEVGAELRPLLDDEKTGLIGGKPPFLLIDAAAERARVAREAVELTGAAGPRLKLDEA